MAGPRDLGQIVDGTQEGGECLTGCSMINFAVPSLQTLSKNKLTPLYPETFEESINKLAERLQSRTIKISVDSKNIARGKGDKMGDIDY